MASQLYKDRLLAAVESLPDDKAARVVQYAESLAESPSRPPRRPRLGTLRGKMKILPSFFDPLPDDLLDAFEGKQPLEKRN
jgi:hypothetical protein